MKKIRTRNRIPAPSSRPGLENDIEEGRSHGSGTKAAFGKGREPTPFRGRRASSPIFNQEPNQQHTSAVVSREPLQSVKERAPFGCSSFDRPGSFGFSSSSSSSFETEQNIGGELSYSPFLTEHEGNREAPEEKFPNGPLELPFRFIRSRTGG